MSWQEKAAAALRHIVGKRTVIARSVIGSGSHSWDAIFHCGQFSCSAEVFAYEVARVPAGKGLRWKCDCGRLRALSPAQVSSMQRQMADDAREEPR
jgi:hypothetical protein